MRKKLHVKLAIFGLYAGLTTLWAAASLWLPDGRFREVVTLAWLLAVPGYVSWRALVGHTVPRLTYKIAGYILGLSVLLLMVVGLSLNQLYIFLDASRPLSRVPLTVAISGTVLCLSAVAATRATRLPKWSLYRRRLLRSVKHRLLAGSMLAAGLLLPALAVLGATTLNNGGSAGLAVTGMCAAAILFLLLLLRERDLGKFYGYILYCMCVSTLMATSMRGWNITGHDVMQEYQVFQLTLSHATWHMKYYHDAYTACLSITILPTVLQKISGVYAPYVFKFVFQAIFAVIATILYGSLRGFVGRRTALLSSFLFIMFPTFITDMAMLNRQEMGLLFFALVLHAGTNAQLSKRVRSVLVFLFMIGMILSHYSTSYVALGALLVAFGIGLVWKFIDPSLRQSKKVNVAALTSIISPVVLSAALLALIGWGTIATQTSSNLTQTVQSITAVLHGSNSSSPATVLANSKPGTEQFSSLAVLTRTLPASSYYPSSVTAKYPVQRAAGTVESDTLFAQALHLPRQLLGLSYDILRNGYALLIEGCIGLGIIYIAFKRRTRETPPRQYLLIGIGIMVIIAVQILVPSAINYGLTRILQQALLLLALPSILVAVWVLRFARIPRHAAETVIGMLLTAFFLV
jgi:uncharacterized membrane protein